MLRVENVTLKFGEVVALDDVSIELKEAEILAIVGPNGSGKTSLFNVINGIYRPQSGKVLIKLQNRQIDITNLSTWKRARLGISRTFQNIRLFSNISVLDNIILGTNLFLKSTVLEILKSLFSLDKKGYIATRQRAEEIIDFLDLKPYRYSLARDLPLGVRKKVELARAIVQQPKILLLDEPTSGLTYEEKSEFLYYVREINEKFGISILVIEHDVKVVSSVAHRVVAMSFGKIISEGSPQTVFQDPKVIETYIGSTNF